MKDTIWSEKRHSLCKCIPDSPARPSDRRNMTVKTFDWWEKRVVIKSLEISIYWLSLKRIIW